MSAERLAVSRRQKSQHEDSVATPTKAPKVIWRKSSRKHWNADMAGLPLVVRKCNTGLWRVWSVFGVNHHGETDWENAEDAQLEAVEIGVRFLAAALRELTPRQRPTKKAKKR